MHELPDGNTRVRVVRIYSDETLHYYQLLDDKHCQCPRCTYESIIARGAGRSRVLVKSVIPEIALWGIERNATPTLLIDIDQFSGPQRDAIFLGIGALLGVSASSVEEACRNAGHACLPIDVSNSVVEVIICDDPLTNKEIADQSLRNLPSYENATLN